MKVSRNFSVAVQYVLDEWVPPRMRDSKILMYLPMKFVLKDAAEEFMGFKEWVFQKSDKEYGELYERTGHVQELQGETDLNTRCTNAILELVNGKNVLEVGCGRGFLAGKLSDKNSVTACDIVLPDNIQARYPKVKFKTANIEKLPFKDASFDVVISTHTLEHVKNLPQAVAELRRVARKELIIVVPRQRPYKYTFSLHTQFFPYAWSLEGAFGFNKGTRVSRLGDWLYYDDLTKS